MIEIDGEHLSIDDVVSVARGMEKVGISEKAAERIEESRRKVEDVLKKGKVVYGINTGFGELSSVRISDEEIEKLQENLIRSHACGTGDELPEEVVRAMILLRINSLAKGHSGVTKELVESLVDGLNRGFHPVVPSQGSVGASGDLAPLAHIALAFMGEGEANYNGVKMPAMEALERAEIEPIKYKAKEGLALINGTQMMTALACLSIHDSMLLLKNAQIAGVMSLEALNGTDQAFREEVQNARPHEGQLTAGKNLWNLTRESEVISSYDKVQDAYSLRCMPQVFGAALDSLNHVKKVVEVEINSATDNPLVFDDIISGGNFHGEPIAIAMDLLGIVMAKISSFSERRIARMLDSNLSGLPPFLAKNAGLNSGMMILQYVAASLVNENKTLSYPSSVDSIPTSANKEDYQSMGATSARKAIDIVKNAGKVISIEFLVASQALEFQEKKTSPASTAAYEAIRKKIPPLEGDRSMHGDIGEIFEMVMNGKIVEAVESRIGKLQA
ncbi:MAG: histidine ammonia-lyase [Deltaproteobacteria bacterium]|nr:histidine ammonia-lyase [Deltaproteobacteria bacterium]